MGVLTIRYTEARGRLAGAMIVRSGYEVMLISREGTIIRTAVDGISRMSRSTQGVRLMNLRGDDTVGSIARVTEPQAPVDGQTELDVEPDDGASPDGQPGEQ
jgi:DNA gyrase subunit A